MDWLKDKKNQPIVAGIAIGVVVIVVACLWFFVLRPAPAATATDATATPDQTAQQTPGGPTPGAPAPGVTPAVPGPGDARPAAPATGAAAPAAPGQPGQPATPAQPAAGAPVPGVKVASVTPMETWRGDPFQPIGYKPTPKVTNKPHIRDFPFDRLPVRVVWDKAGNDRRKQKAEIQQPSRRMAGILLNDRVYAIIEAGGVSQVVQPGDYTTDRLAMVERIEPDRVVLKTVDEKPRYITVKMAASPMAQSGSGSPSAPTSSSSGTPRPIGIGPMDAPPRGGAVP